uniref:pyridoxal 5'-phosphate synthase n=1 Tax=Cacopsylla melanoneura TaxID=428564 RepID=A0A8D8S3L7_9HEMI
MAYANGELSKWTTLTNGNGQNGTHKTEEIGKSGLSKIENPTDNPFELFQEWLSEARQANLVLPHALVLSTATTDGKVSSRTLLLRRLEEDGFVIMTDNRSRKHTQITENKSAAMVFLWLYRTKDGDKCLNRQVRIEGELEVLDPERFQDLYEREPTYCKIRAHLCHQSTTTDWEQAKAAHDEMYEQYKRNEIDLPMPDHFIAYKLHPTMMEFYHAESDQIGDRIHYSKTGNKADNIWKRKRLFA